MQAAIRRQRRKAVSVPRSTYEFGTCLINFDQMTAECAGHAVVMTTLEFKLLRFFVSNAELYSAARSC